MIPKILHQCSKAYVWEERRLAQRAQSLMPNYEYRAWNDDSNLELVKQIIPQHTQAYLDLPAGVIRVDIARCLYMYAFGGIYFDTDYVFYKPLDAEFHAQKCILAVEEETCASVGGQKLGNAFMASEPGFAMWLAFIDDIFVRAQAGETKIVMLSGPHGLTLFLKSHPEYMGEITMLPGHVIYPQFAMAKITAKRTKETIGAHLCWGSWRGKPFIQSVRNRMRRWVSAVV